VGGTFTDLVVLEAPNRPRVLKVATALDQAESVASAVDQACQQRPPTLAHGTTVATNAVLQRSLAHTVLLTTSGLTDVLTIARQQRPSLYDLAAVKPDPVVVAEDVLGVCERTGEDGEPLEPLVETEVDRVVEAVAARAPDAVAVSLLFSYAGPGHERRLTEALSRRLDVPISRSSALLPELREYERTSTIALNAGLVPVVRGYLNRLAEHFADTRLSIMTSSGGTTALPAAAEAPVHTLLSGPAAGAVAAASTARAAGRSEAVALDMGGTSTDACLIRKGAPQVSAETTMAELPFRTPSVDIHTVGAGGGSVAWIDSGGALRVGPGSAGAVPGPACYGLGGTAATVTDAHCALGHLDPDRPLGEAPDGGGVRLDPDAAARVVDELPGGAAGVLTVARATMGRALRRVSTECGVEPGGLTLVAYGGAGPLHASALAAELGLAAVLIPPYPGVLSALGLLLAPPRYEALRTVIGGAADDLESVWAELAEEARTALAAQGVTAPARLSYLADCRYAGQSHELRLTLSTADGDAADGARQPRPAGVTELFHDAHRNAYGYAIAGETVEVVTVRVVAEGSPALTEPPDAWGLSEPADAPRLSEPADPDKSPAESAAPADPATEPTTGTEPQARRIGVVRSGGECQWVTASVLSRAELAPGACLDGPAVVEQPDATTLLRPGDRAEVDDRHNLVVDVAPGQR
jgi:N-methylhydantoinase A